VFLLVPTHPGSPGQRAVKRSLLLLLLLLSSVMQFDVCPTKADLVTDNQA